MNNMPDLKSIFGKFVGKTLLSPVIREMQEEAGKNGLSLRINTPDMLGDCEWIAERVNVNVVEKGDQLIIHHFDIG